VSSPSDMCGRSTGVRPLALAIARNELEQSERESSNPLPIDGGLRRGKCPRQDQDLSICAACGPGRCMQVCRACDPVQLASRSGEIAWISGRSRAGVSDCCGGEPHGGRPPREPKWSAQTGLSSTATKSRPDRLVGRGRASAAARRRRRAEPPPVPGSTLRGQSGPPGRRDRGRTRRDGESEAIEGSRTDKARAIWFGVRGGQGYEGSERPWVGTAAWRHVVESHADSSEDVTGPSVGPSARGNQARVVLDIVDLAALMGTVRHTDRESPRAWVVRESVTSAEIVGGPLSDTWAF